MADEAIPIQSANSVKELPVQRRTRETFSGGSNRTISPLLQNAYQALTQFNDDLGKEFGDKVWDSMMKDSAVSACIEILKVLILADPLQVVPNVKDKDAADYEISLEVSKFVERQLTEADRPLVVILYELLEALVYGSALAEICYESDIFFADDGTSRPIYRFKDLKTKSRKFYSFVCDRFYNVLGAVSREVSTTYGIVTLDQLKLDASKIAPREKLVILTVNSKYGDPRGYSLLIPAYNAWYVKTQVWPQYLKFLVQFASPSIAGFTPLPEEIGEVDEVEATDENGNPEIDPTTGQPRTLTVEEDMFETLLGFMGGTAAVFKGGSKLEILWSQGNGEAFLKAIELLDKQIAMAILKTARTLLESKNSSKADSESAADITDVFVSMLRDLLGGTIKRDLVTQIVKTNYPPEIAKRYVPDVMLAAAQKQDLPKMWAALATLFTSGFIDDSQVPELDATLSLPKRDFETWKAEREQEKEDRRMNQQELMKVSNPKVGSKGSDPAPTKKKEA